MSDAEILEDEPEESYTASWSLVTVPTSAAQEATEIPKMDEVRERFVKDYPRLFGGVANQNIPDGGQFGTARINWSPSQRSIGIENISSKVSGQRP